MPMVFITEPNSYQDTRMTLSVQFSDISDYSCLGGDCSISVSVKQTEGVPHLVHLGGRKPGVHVWFLPRDWWQTEKVTRTMLFPARDEAGASLGGNLEGPEPGVTRQGRKGKLSHIW